VTDPVVVGQGRDAPGGCAGAESDEDLGLAAQELGHVPVLGGAQGAVEEG
jgi:hypothetical protein